MSNQALNAQRSAFGMLWQHVLDVCLTAWVLRAPLAMLIIGAVLMWWVPQAQDLLLELAMPATLADWFRILLFYLLLLLVWAMPTHYAARLLIRTDAGYLRRVATRNTCFIKCLQEWSPRVLGALTFVVMLGGVWRAWYNQPLFSDPQEEFPGLSWHLLFVGLGLVVSGVVFWLYAVYRSKYLLGAAPIVRSERLASHVMTPLRGVSPALTTQPTVTSHLGPLLLLLMFFGFAFLPMIFPLGFAEYLPRTLSVPFVLGGWVPLLAYLSGLGRRVHAPLILGGYLLLCLLPLALGNNYAIRRIATNKAMAPGKLDLEYAIKLWRTANKCSTAPCPRPLIIAAAGGASRAGFFTASVIGQLLDDQLRVNGKGHGLKPEQMANRIFALSTVSGSSVGAVMTVASLAASERGIEPCDHRAAPLWDGKTITSWRACLEALTSGDFLTPIFTGFVFRDMFGFLDYFIPWPDRGVLLEKAVESQFNDLVASPKNEGHLPCVGRLDCAFATLQPTEDHWVPLLLLNSTSVKTGQRIITTALNWQFDPAAGVPCPNNIREQHCDIFLRSANFYDWQGPHPNPLEEVRLSTAAHNSARFPLLSPPGAIVDAEGRVVDRLVDGGYFENFGALTATELARAIRAVDPQLRPFIVVLSNDPEVVVKKSAPAEKIESSSVFLTDVFSPLYAFEHARNAHGVLAVDGAAVALDHQNPDQCNTTWIRVWSEPDPHNPDKAKARPLSMSWWLSKPVQRYLHEQTEFVGTTAMNGHKNKNRIQELLNAIADAKLSPAKAHEIQCIRDDS